MTADWAIGQPDDRDRVLLSQPFDTSTFTLVTSGANDFGTWELRDGPHPRVEDPNALGQQLIVHHRNGNDTDTDTGGGGAALSHDQTASVSTLSTGVGQGRHGYILARCNDRVFSGQVSFDDGTSEEILATASSSTGHRWLVCMVRPHPTPVRISFTDADGSTLESQDLATPPAPPSN